MSHDQGRFSDRAVLWGLLLGTLLAAGECFRVPFPVPEATVPRSALPGATDSGSSATNVLPAAIGGGISAVIGLLAVWGTWVLSRPFHPGFASSFAAGGTVLLIWTCWLTTLVPAPFLASYLTWASVLLITGLSVTVTAAMFRGGDGETAGTAPDEASSRPVTDRETERCPETFPLDAQSLSAAPPVLQSWTRMLTDEGELLEGTIRVSFAPGERIVRRHIPIAPPFSAWPEGWCACDDGQTFEPELDWLRSYGARLTVRRRGDVTQPAETEVCVLLRPLRADRRVA